MEGESGETVHLMSRLHISPLQRLWHAMGNRGGDAALTLGRNVMRFSLTRWLPALVVGATLLAAAPASAQRVSPVFVPPQINQSTVQSNWNHWSNGGYPNVIAAKAYNLALANAVFGNLYNPVGVGYVPPYYSPYLYSGYNPALYGAGYGYGGNPYATQASISTGYSGGPGTASLSTVDPYINPYTTNPYVPYYDPYGGYLRGQADLTTATANAAVTVQRARLVQEEVFRSQLDTRRKIWEEARYERMSLMNSEQVRLANMQSALDRARREPPLSEIWSGQSLNDLLRHLIEQQGKDVKGPTVPISDDILKHINLTAGPGTGNVGLLRTDLKWPAPLRRPEFDEPRKSLNVKIPNAVDEAKKSGRVGQGQLRDIKDDMQAMHDILRRLVDDMAPGDYIEAKHYLNTLNESVKALSDPNVANFFNDKWVARGKTVGELVENLRRKEAAGLTFAPAAPGDEWAYRALYYALRDYDAGMQVSSKQPPP
jgi:hypothetical protein